jgi:L-ascorbate metabolism protein UlaG (beta-lactamase superfamily)
VEITWLSHSSFRLRSGSTTLIADPFPDSLGVSMPAGLREAQVVTVSNSHPNHSASHLLNGDSVLLNGPGEYEVASLYIKGVRTPLAQPPPEEEGENGSQWNTIFTIEMDGLVVCHLGDLGGPITSRQIEELLSPQVLMIPVGGDCTLSPEEAAEVVNVISPRVVIPMHYKVPGVSSGLEGLAPFIKALGTKPQETQSRLNVTQANLPGEIQVVVLHAAAVSSP